MLVDRLQWTSDVIDLHHKSPFSQEAKLL